MPDGDGPSAPTRPAGEPPPGSFSDDPARVKGSMLRTVLVVVFGWLLMSVPVGLFTLLALFAGVDCGQECGGDAPGVAPVLFTCAALMLILGPVLVGWSVRRPWSPAWKIGVGIAVPPLVVFVLLATGGI